ncbi:hypothetical protein ACP4OV_011337 [Aristida adscensionis]
MEAAAAALEALCRGGGWSYAAVWRPHPHDPRLLTLAENYCEDEATAVVQKMLNQVHIVGQGVIGKAFASGECQWISEDTCSELNQRSHADNQDLFQGYTWWQHQFRNGVKTIAVLPLQSHVLVQIGSFREIPKNSDIFNQVRSIFSQIKGNSREPGMEYSQTDALAYGQEPILTPSMTDIFALNKVNQLDIEKLESIERTESLRSSVCSPSNSERSLNDLTSHGTGRNSMNTQILALPVNSMSVYELKGFGNVTNFLNQNVDVRTPLQVNYSKETDSSFTGIMSAYKRLNNLHRTKKESFGQNMPECPPYFFTTTNSPNSDLDKLCNSGTGFSSSFTKVSGKANTFLQTESEKLLRKSISLSGISEIHENCLTPQHVLMHEPPIIPGPDECPSLLSSEESFIIQSDLMQLKDATRFTCQANSTFPELPNRSPEEATAGTADYDMKEYNANSGLLECMIVDLSANSHVQDWWDYSTIVEGNLPKIGDTQPEYVTELGKRHSVSTVERISPSISIVEKLLGSNDNFHDDVDAPLEHSPLTAEASALAGCGSDYQLLQLDFQECLTSRNAQLPSLASSSYTIGNAQNCSSKVTSVPPANISPADSCSFNTANSKTSQSDNPEGIKTSKKRARAGESTRPRPKDRQLIQDRVKELREIVPNSAKCSIDALLDRTIKHMLFLQSVTKYADKMKQTDEPPQMIDKASGVVLKDNPTAGKNVGATWAYEVAGQTMVCPIIIEDLSPPGQMLVEMLCEERGFFLEIADNIRGFGLTILKGLMELRDGKIWARFLVEANQEVTRMDVFLSLVQLLEQNSLTRPTTDQMAKVMNNGVPSFANHQQCPVPIPVGIAETLQ